MNVFLFIGCQFSLFSWTVLLTNLITQCKNSHKMILEQSLVNTNLGTLEFVSFLYSTKIGVHGN